MKDKRWYIKLVNKGDVVSTVTTDGYVYDSSKKLFVLKKNTMNMLQSFIDDHIESDLADENDSKLIVKVNLNPKITIYSEELYNKIIKTIFKAESIKHPMNLFDELIQFIEELIASGELEDMKQTNPQDAIVDEIFNRFIET